MKRCPECGWNEFFVIAKITEEWLVDGNGKRIETTVPKLSVVHRPNNKDEWICAKCGYSNKGYEFEKEEE